MRALPGVAPSAPGSGTTNPAASPLRLVPATADPIPDSVLAHPIIGEARRFDGTVAPANWLFAQGQTLKVAENRALFSVLGSVAGGDGKTTFKLPNAQFGLLVAVAGQLMTTPSAVSQSERRMTRAGSVVPGSQPAPRRAPKLPSAAMLAEQRLLRSAIRVGPASPERVARELAERIRQAGDDARTAALAALSASNRARLTAAVENAVAGRMRPYGVVTEMVGSLTNAEVDVLLEISDSMTRAFQADVERHHDPQLEAARFLASVAVTREQLRTMLLRERSVR
jgi:Phage Tail Collar Domain